MSVRAWCRVCVLLSIRVNGFQSIKPLQLSSPNFLCWCATTVSSLGLYIMAEDPVMKWQLVGICSKNSIYKNSFLVWICHNTVIDCGAGSGIRDQFCTDPFVGSFRILVYRYHEVSAFQVILIIHSFEKRDVLCCTDRRIQDGFRSISQEIFDISSLNLVQESSGQDKDQVCTRWPWPGDFLNPAPAY